MAYARYLGRENDAPDEVEGGARDDILQSYLPGETIPRLHVLTTIAPVCGIVSGNHLLRE